MCRQQVVEHPDACVTLWGSFCALTCPGVVTVRVQYLQQRCMCEFVGQSLGSDVLWYGQYLQQRVCLPLT